MAVRFDQAIIARLLAPMYGHPSAPGMAVVEHRKRAAKSESLTIRLNPRTRFVLEFVARMRGQTITTVVERAIEAAGDQARIRISSEEDMTWKDFWDISEGVRALRVAREPELFPTYEEEKRLDFAKQHSNYFFDDYGHYVPNRQMIDLLWPNIDELIELHEKTRNKDYFAAEKRMRRIILDAGVRPPKSKSGVRAEEEVDPDDDIPF